MEPSMVGANPKNKDVIKCAVVLRRSPELRDHVVLQPATIADKFAVMSEMILTWIVARRMFSTEAYPTAT